MKKKKVERKKNPLEVMKRRENYKVYKIMIREEKKKKVNDQQEESERE